MAVMAWRYHKARTASPFAILMLAAELHDVGKLIIPTAILCKPSTLNNNEFALIKNHALGRYEILKNIAFKLPIAEIVLQHHARINGSGYPRGLTGKQILLEAKILAVADVVEAMSSHRPYRATMAIELALEKITKNKSVLYDEVVV